MKLEMCLQRQEQRRVKTEKKKKRCKELFYLKTRLSGKEGFRLLERQDVRPGDGVSVDESEELLEDGEEGPVGQDADALLGVETAAGDGPAVHHAEQAEPDVLPLGQKIPGKRLVELDGSAVDLQDRDGVTRCWCSPPLWSI